MHPETTADRLRRSVFPSTEEMAGPILLAAQADRVAVDPQAVLVFCMAAQVDRMVEMVSLEEDLVATTTHLRFQAELVKERPPVRLGNPTANSTPEAAVEVQEAGKPQEAQAAVAMAALLLQLEAQDHPHMAAEAVVEEQTAL